LKALLLLIINKNDSANIKEERRTEIINKIVDVEEETVDEIEENRNSKNIF